MLKENVIVKERVKSALQEMMAEAYDEGYRCAYRNGRVNDCPTFSTEMMTCAWIQGFDDGSKNSHQEL